MSGAAPVTPTPAITDTPPFQVAPPQPGTASAFGRILWNGQPVSDLEVKLKKKVNEYGSIEEVAITATTDLMARYTLPIYRLADIQRSA